MPARPARNLGIRETAMKFADVPFNETILTNEAFDTKFNQLTALVDVLSGEVMELSAELYSTTPDASGDIWVLSAAIDELRPTTQASNLK